jgi:hypothetical protein
MFIIQKKIYIEVRAYKHNTFFPIITQSINNKVLQHIISLYWALVYSSSPKLTMKINAMKPQETSGSVGEIIMTAFWDVALCCLTEVALMIGTDLTVSHDDDDDDLCVRDNESYFPEEPLLTSRVPSFVRCITLTTLHCDVSLKLGTFSKA